MRPTENQRIGASGLVVIIPTIIAAILSMIVYEKYGQFAMLATILVGGGFTLWIGKFADSFQPRDPDSKYL